MSGSFDPYHKWLGISPKDQPPNHYRLLAIDFLESDPDVISSAADARMAHVRAFQTGQHSALSQDILNEIAAARICLLNAEKKAEYDRQLQEQARGVRVFLRWKRPGIRQLPAGLGLGKRLDEDCRRLVIGREHLRAGVVHAVCDQHLVAGAVVGADRPI